jgi:ornithine lipid hydroxylase
MDQTSRQEKLDLLIARLYYPIFVVGCIGFHWALTTTAMLPLLIPSVVASAALVIVGLSERAMPYLQDWNRARSREEVIKDALSTLLLLPIVMGGCQYLWQELVPHIDIWPNHLWKPLQLLLAIAMAEFFFYWAHRFSHEKSWLWRFHFEHHSVRRVYFLNSGRLHPVDAFLDFFCYFFPILILGVPSEIFDLFLTITMVTGVLEHANVHYRAGVLNYFFNTAELHRWHHSVSVEISQKNYGKISSVWDLVFGTFYLPQNDAGIENVGAEPEITRVLAEESQESIPQPKRRLS